MEERHHDAHHILCVISESYLTKPYSSWERRAAQWAAVTDRPNFALPVFVEPCKVKTLFAPIKRCDLYEIDEDEARMRIKEFLAPAAQPSSPTSFPGGKPSAAGPPQRRPVTFPGQSQSPASPGISNIPIAVPQHFLGREDDLAAITDLLAQDKARAAITGMRGVGKSTLAAVYAERHRRDYRATWWIKAQTESGMRADLVGLGVRAMRNYTTGQPPER